MLSLLVDGSDVFTGDTLFKGSVGGVRAPGQHELRRPQALDHGRAARAAARDDDPPRPHGSDDGRRRARVQRASCASGAARTPRTAANARRWARRRRSCCSATTTTAGTRPGSAGPTDRDDIVPGSQGLASVRRHEPRAVRRTLGHHAPDRKRIRCGGRRDRPAVLGAGQPVAAAITPVIVALTSEAPQEARREDPDRRGLAQDAPGHRGPPARRPRLRGPRPRGGARSRSIRGRPTIRSACASPSARSFFTRQRDRAGARHRRCWPSAIAAVVVTASELAIFGDSVSAAAPHDLLRRQAAQRDADTDGDADRRRRRPTPEKSATPTATPSETPTPTPSATRDGDAERGAERRDARARGRHRRPPRSLGVWPRTGSRPRASPARRG